MIAEVSVLLPYRNAGETIEEAIESVLAERGIRVEVVAIDDGSVDDGPLRAARLEASHAGVRALRSPGRGIVAALAFGLESTRAPFVGRMDGDDVSLPGRFAREVDLLRSDPRLAVAGVRVEAFPAEAVGEGLRRYVDWQNGLTTPEEHARQIFVEAPLCHPSVVVRREALDDVGAWREVPWAEDYDLWLRLDARGWRLAKVPELLFRWRHRPGRATFLDPRYAPGRFREAKAPHLAARLEALARPVVVWGAGATGRRLARALEPHGLRAERFVDVDPRKIGRTARGVPIVAPDLLVPGPATVVVAVGARGARDLVRARLAGLGLVEGADFLCAA